MVLGPTKVAGRNADYHSRSIRTITGGGPADPVGRQTWSVRQSAFTLYAARSRVKSSGYKS